MSRVACRGLHVEGHSLRVRKSRSRVKSNGQDVINVIINWPTSTDKNTSFFRTIRNIQTLKF